MKDISFINNVHFCVVPLEEYVHHIDEGERRGETYTIVALYGVYLVNESEQDIEKVIVRAGEYATMDDELVQSNTSLKDYQRLSKNHMLLLETFEPWVLDFVVWYYFDLWLDDESHVKLHTQITKTYELTAKYFHEVLPVIGKKGYILPWGNLEKAVLSHEL